MYDDWTGLILICVNNIIIDDDDRLIFVRDLNIIYLLYCEGSLTGATLKYAYVATHQ